MSLLAVLVLSPGRVVSTDRLVDELWGESPPRSARHLLHVYVSSLRKALAGATPRDVLVTQSPGYVLELEEDELDARRFERLAEDGRRALADGDAERAASRLRDALALWRGPPLAEFTYEPFAQAEIARLEEVRLAAIEDRVEAGLALGSHAGLVAELEALVRESPLRERLRGQLMLALYRSGRQAEALEAYRDAHRTLADELGLEPGAALRQLERAILAQDPELELERRDAHGAVHATRKFVTVLVARLVEEPDLDPVDPEVRVLALGPTLDAVGDVLRRRGARVERAIGEEVVAIFGVPVAREDDALRAVQAAVAVRDAVPGLRIALESGETVVDGANVSGDVAPRALRLARAGGAAAIVAGDSTYRLVRHAVDVEEVDGSRVLVGVDAGAPPIPIRLDSTLVGRRAELDLLAAAAERAFRERTTQVVTVVGDAGVGKSRLVREFAALAEGDPAFVDVRCASDGQGLSFAPLREALRRVAGDVSTEALSRLAGREDVARTVASLLGANDAKVRREEAFAAFRSLFVAMARKRPLLLAFEDVHWAEPTLLDLVEHLAEWTRDAPLLLICATRPELLERRPSWVEGDRILLEPLSEAESGELLDDLADGDTLPGPMRERIVRAAEGNPLFLEQLYSIPATDDALPPTIRSVLAARLDQLGPAERAIVACAAVVGREFTVREVDELLPVEARTSVSRQLRTLAERRLVEEHGAGFRFRHALIHEAAYRAIPKAVRAETHERFANRLAAEPDLSTGDAEETLGRHLERAWSYANELSADDERVRALAARACRHLAASGTRALDRGDVTAAVTLLERAFGLATRGTSAGAEIAYRLNDALTVAGPTVRAAEVRAVGLEDARAAGDRAAELRLVVAEADGRWGSLGDPRVADELTELVLPELEGDDLATARALSVVGGVAMAAGRHADALDAYEDALRHALLADDVKTVDGSAVWLVNVMSDGPTPVEAALQRADELRATLGPIGAATLGATTALMIAAQGRLEEARALHARTCEQLEEMGVRSVVVHALAGEMELLAGDPAIAERELGVAWELMGATGHGVPWIAERRSRALRELARIDDAREFLGIAEAAVSSAQGELVARTRATRALIRLDDGDVEGAVEDALQADRLSEPLESPPYESPRYRGEILLAAAEVLAGAGRSEAAAQRADAAARQFERKGYVVSAARARALAGTRLKVPRAS